MEKNSRRSSLLIVTTANNLTHTLQTQPESEPDMFQTRSHGGLRRILALAVLIVAVGGIVAAVSMSELEGAPPVSPVKVIRTFPHDPDSFCQGLVVFQGNLLEGTGQYGRSRLRLVEINSGEPITDYPLGDDEFGEGVTVWKDRILQLTWKNGYMIVYDASTWKQVNTVRLKEIHRELREGWGITHDGTHLIISDGSATLRFVNPDTMKQVRSVVVKNGFQTLSKLNELEFVDGEIYANVWYEDKIARIDPASGKVLGWIDLSAVRPKEVRFDREAVLNGIAWDGKQRRLFVTGKNWPTVFEIEPVTGR